VIEQAANHQQPEVFRMEGLAILARQGVLFFLRVAVSLVDEA
jgi:hypothetical protein